MKEIKLKRITLFILEIIILQNGRCIDESFAAQINDFIYKYYDDNKELFELLFDKGIIEEFIKNNWELLSEEIMINLIKKYYGFAGYINLIDDIGYEIDQNINILVIKFLEYYDELLKLKWTEPSSYPRILQ